MRFIPKKPNYKLPEDPTNRFFIELWYDMVHKNSLDSYRVRCMDSLNILHELQSLLQKPSFSNIGRDIKRVAEESVYILRGDQTISAHFTDHYHRVLPLIEQAANEKDEKKLPEAVTSYYLKDFVLSLEARYITVILTELEKALFNTKNRDDVFHYTGILLSRLLDEGHSLEGLYGIVFNVFIRNTKNPDDATFQRNFDLAKRIITQGEQAYEVIFKLNYSGNTPTPYSSIMTVTFRTELTEYQQALKLTKETKTDLLIPRQNVLFALVRVQAQEDRTAGLKAGEIVDSTLDLLRYELEQEEIHVEREFFCVRLNDMSARPFALPSQIPNPVKNVREEEFQQFVQTVVAIAENSDIEAELKKRIHSAFRFYRMGRDVKEFENKFLNWWTGLEYLIRSGDSGSIITSVEKIVINALVVTYLTKLLSSLADGFAAQGIKPSDAARARFSVSDYQELNLDDFYDLLHDSAEVAHIQPLLADFPLFEYRLHLFTQRTKDAASVKAFLERHEKHLRWHIHRLYRIRCDIVHSAEYTLNLTLLCANLEFYLKSLLAFVLDKMRRNTAISSLNELYERASFVKLGLMDSLSKNSLDVLHHLLRTGEV